jgi:tRNA threonylcarbamoyladenosine biosynthesis protein TsaB
MRVLSLDTTTRAGSIALVADGRVVDERRGDPLRTHAERLPGDLLALLAAHALTLSAIDVFAVASGPGSFTGLRIGIATIQGAAFVEQRPVVGVSALSALAQIGSANAQPGDLVAAWMDAYRRDVFSALYRVSGAAAFEPARLVEVEAPMVDDPVATLQRWERHIAGKPITFLGDGAVLYAEAIEQHTVAPHRIVREVPLLAGAIGRMASAVAAAGTACAAGGVQALYVRRPDVEIARENAAPGTER